MASAPASILAIGKRLFVLLACLFVVMIGVGITLPVLPFYVERLAQAEGAMPQAVVMHVALLTAAYPLGQLVFAPVWGLWSDRTGRRPLLLMGMAGYVLAQILFGLATSLWLLYATRFLGGILSSATLPVSAAYVADATTDVERGQGMAWLGTATSLGFVVGPALGGILAGSDLHLTVRYGHLMIDGFSVPFFAAAALGLVSFAAALRWLPESHLAHAPQAGSAEPDWPTSVRALGTVLGLALGAQFALAMFEATFALHAKTVLNYGPAEMGTVFLVCGLVMAVFQIGASGLLTGRVREMGQIGMGFVLMGTSLVTLMILRRMSFVLAVVGLLAMGMALVAPNVAALISMRGGNRRAGTALGAQNAANSLGQASGPLVGGALFVWQMHAPYLLTGGLLIVIALVIGWQLLARRHTGTLAS